MNLKISDESCRQGELFACVLLGPYYQSHQEEIKLLPVLLEFECVPVDLNGGTKNYISGNEISLSKCIYISMGEPT
jgi:hypothetical protein